MTTLIGLDLSLTAPAAVVLSASWAPGDWTNIPTCEPDTRKRSGESRLAYVRAELAAFVALHNPTHAYVEEYSFSSRVSHLASLGELGGVVKVMLWERGVIVTPVPAASARKLLLGKLPGHKALNGVKMKDHVNHQLARMGATFTSMDLGDAFVCANAGRALLGLPFVGVDPERARAEVFGGVG